MHEDRNAPPGAGRADVDPAARVDHEHELGKGLKQRHVTMITFGGVIGAGLFVGSSAAIATVGPGIVISYTLAGLIVLFVMRMLGEMAALHPGLGSFTEYARLGLGHWAGFTAGWLYWYFWVIVVAVEAIAGAAILREWVPLPVWAIGLVLMTIMTIVNLMSARSYGEFEFWFASIKVAAILVFIGFCVLYMLGLVNGQRTGFGGYYAYGGLVPFGPSSIVAGVATVIFSLIGAEIATVAAAESDEPSRAIAQLTNTVAVRIILFYVCSIGLIVAVVPWNIIVTGDSPFTVALDYMNVPAGSFIMKMVVLVAVLSCLNSGMYITSRVLFTLSQKGDAPGWLVELNSRKVPARAILTGAALSFIGVILSYLSAEVVFAFLINASGAVMLIIYLMIALAEIRLRRDMHVEDMQLRMWLYPWLSYATVVGIVIVLASMLFETSMAQQLYTSLFSVAIVLAAYRLLRHERQPQLS